MKKIATLALLSAAALLNGCGIDSSRLNAKRDQQSSETMSAADQDLYASETLESSDTSSSTQAVDSSANVDEMIKAHVKEMANRMLKELDADSSGSLSLVEFLVGPEKLRKKIDSDARPDPSDEQKAKMKEKLTADFKEFAGDDGQLSSDELQKLLLARGPKKGGREGGPDHDGRRHGPHGKGKGRGPMGGRVGPPPMPGQN